MSAQYQPVGAPFPVGGTTLVAAANSGGVSPTFVAPPGFLGVFGTGRWRVFSANGTFNVPAGVTQVRARVLGGAAAGTTNGRGGCGGGYAHGVLDVSPLSAIAIVVGAGGATSGAAGGSSSFGSSISATGGTSSAGGTGSGGDFQATGGVSSNTVSSGGGAAGTQMGDGGASGLSAGIHASGGGAVGGWASSDATGLSGQSSGGASAFGDNGNYPRVVGGPDCVGVRATGGDGSVNPINAVIRFPLDGYTGGGGAAAGRGGPGAGGGGCSSTPVAGPGGAGGGGGGNDNSGTSGPGASGGYGGGGGGTGNGGMTGGVGGSGLVIVEW